MGNPSRPQTEEQLYEQLVRYLRLRYPDVPFHFDLSGLWTPSHRLRNLYGRLNNRAWPDLFIATPAVTETGERYHGLFLELKRDGSRLRKADGSWASAHIAEQALVLADLAEQRYVAQFAVGLAEAIELIDSYLEARHA